MLKSILILSLFSVMPLEDSWLTDAPIASSSQQARQVLPDSIRAIANGDGEWEVMFNYRPKTPLEPDDRISLMGSFNHWNRRAHPMTLQGDGTWMATTKLPEGTYWYKFLIHDDQWLPDPLNQDRSPDGHGGQNTVLRLGAEANLDPSLARIGDGRIEGLGLGHDPTRALYRQSQADGSWRRTG